MADGDLRTSAFDELLAAADALDMFVVLDVSDTTGDNAGAGGQLKIISPANTQATFVTDAYVGALASVAANTAKSTNVSTTLSAGTVTATTYGITSDGGVDDIVLPEATTSVAGLLGAAKWDEIVANSLKTTNATHSGDVAGDTTLTIQPSAISGLALVTAVSTDMVLLWDATDSALKRADVADFVGSGDPDQNIFETVAGDSGTSPVADSVTDTLTIAGGTGIDTVGDSGSDTITIAIDATVPQYAVLGSYTKPQFYADETIAFSVTLAIDLSDVQVGHCVMTDDMTVNFSNPQAGCSYTFYFEQGAGFPHVITDWDVGTNVIWSGGVPPVLAVGSGENTAVTLQYMDGVLYGWFGYGIGSDVLAYDARVQQFADLADPANPSALVYNGSVMAYYELGGSDVIIMTGTTGTDGWVAKWNSDGDLVDGVVLPTGALAGLTDTQLFTNKSLSDLTTFIVDSADNTRKLTFDVGTIATSTTRTITMPNTDVDLTDIATNSAKVSNATHTGDVTGATATVIDPTAISGKTLVTAVATDMILLWDATDSAIKRADIADLLAGSGDLLADGTIPLTADWDVGAFTITGTRFISDIATGTAPFTVSSTTEVANLQAATVGTIAGLAPDTATTQATQAAITSAANLVTVGALNAGSITSGFGAIDNGASNISTTGAIAGGTLELTDDDAVSSTVLNLYNPNTTDDAAQDFTWSTDTTGVGAASNVEHTSIVSQVTTHDHATLASTLGFHIAIAGTKTFRASIDATGFTSVGTITGTTITTSGALELGHATDTTIARVSAGLVSIEGSNILMASNIGGSVQAQGDVLDDLNTLGANAADSEFLVGTAAGALAWESGVTVRTSLGLGVLAVMAEDNESLILHTQVFS